MRNGFPFQSCESGCDLLAASRNAIHEAMKINVHPISPWPARVIQLRDSLMSGYKLLPAYDVAVRWARRSEVVCYAPSDFSFQVS